MTYASGGLIQAEDYNVFAFRVNRVWGTGTGDSGYGQSTTIANISASTTVTASQWSTIRDRVNSATQHQFGTNSNVGVFSSGAVVSYNANVPINLDRIYDNRLIFNSTRGTPSTTTLGNVWNTATPTVFNQVRTITFTSGDAARYFFNGGGRIGIALSVSSGTDNNKETDWTNLTAAVGTYSIDALTSVRSGTGANVTVDGSANGYHDLSSANVTLIKISSTTSPYTANNLEIIIKTNGTQGSNGDKGSVLTCYINYYDAESDLWAADAVNMTMWANVVITPPETTNLTNTWGTPTVT